MLRRTFSGSLGGSRGGQWPGALGAPHSELARSRRLCSLPGMMWVQPGWGDVGAASPFQASRQGGRLCLHDLQQQQQQSRLGRSGCG
eukprot:913451-Pelagomonas_calceolata.AAC.2